MSLPGDQNGGMVERIRPAPRPVRPAAEPEEDEVFLTPMEPEMELEELVPETLPIFRPDRSRMAPISLDLHASKKLEYQLNKQNEATRRNSPAKSDGLLLRAGAGILFFLLISGLWWLRGSPAPEELAIPDGTPSPESITSAPTDPALVMLQAFLDAPDAAAKSAFVLAAERVRPLMEAAYAKASLPESYLKPGIPQRQAQGITVVPTRVENAYPFLILIFCREKEGKLKLDWETYHQEISQRLTDFTESPGSPAGLFSVVLERTHSFEAGPGAVCLRLAPPGHAVSTEAVLVAEEARPSITDSLPWNERRRALARLEWEMPPGKPFRMVLRGLERWDFVP